jgi:ABC-2 type transport system ATP-binding protein
MLTGLSKPSAGFARVLGYDVVSEIVEVKKHIGVAFGLYERKDDLFGTFSRGMKRALTIAAALIHNPHLLFLDEPTVGLDVVAARSLRNLISNLCRQGVTVFLTTHYLEEADLLCNRIAIIVNGRILKIDTPEMLKTVAEEEPIIKVSFKKTVSRIIEELSRKLPELNVVTTNHNKVRIYGGESPLEVLEKVLQYARSEGVEIDKVNSVKPSLEDAFIKITGLSPTIMAVEKGGK